MTKKIYVIMGATGHIGHTLTQELLKHSHHVIALGRNQRKLATLKAGGAQVIATEDFDRLDVLNTAFKGAQAVFSFIPPNYSAEDYPLYQDRVGETIKTAVEKNHVPFVVNLSSLAAHLSENTGPIKGLYRQEQRLNTLKSTQVLHVRPGYFMENLLMSIPSIYHTGIHRSPLLANNAIDLIATQDIAYKVAEFLHRLDFNGHTVFELVGPRPLNMIETTRRLGKAIKKPDLQYEQISYEEAEKQMHESRIKPSRAKLMVEMYKAINEGKFRPTQKITAEHRGQTTLETFAEVFAHAYKEQEKQTRDMGKLAM